MTESGQPMENLEEFIPDKGKGQARLKHSFFFFFEARKENQHGYKEEEERELTGKRGSLKP